MCVCVSVGLPWLSAVNLPAMQETQVQTLGWEDSPGGGNSNPLQYSCLGHPMDRGAWWAAVCGVARVRHGWATKPPPPCQCSIF